LFIFVFSFLLARLLLIGKVLVGEDAGGRAVGRMQGFRGGMLEG
jgi:hypothetical protein